MSLILFSLFFQCFYFLFYVLSFKTKVLPSFLFLFSRRESRERWMQYVGWLTLRKDNRQTGVGWGEVKPLTFKLTCT